LSPTSRTPTEVKNNNNNNTNTFIIVVVVVGCDSDGWADRPDVVDGVEEHIAGGVSMKLYSPEIADFDQYYFRLKPHTNRRNPWFGEFWQERFRCHIDGSDRDPRYRKRCTGQSAPLALTRPVTSRSRP